MKRELTLDQLAGVSGGYDWGAIGRQAGKTALTYGTIGAGATGAAAGTVGGIAGVPIGAAIGAVGGGVLGGIVGGGREMTRQRSAAIKKGEY